MSRTGELRILFASDGSTAAKAAVRAGLRFPWPSGARAYGVVAKHVPRGLRRSALLATLDQTTEREAARLRRSLSSRWTDDPVSVVDGAPVEAILGEAARIRAGAVVMGWRGHGAVRRLIAGSVSRGVVRAAPCPVLVVRQARPEMLRVVLGFDGSPQSRTAVSFVARLAPGPGGHVTVVTAVPPVYEPSRSLTRPTRRQVEAATSGVDARHVDRAQRALNHAARLIAAAGWEVATAVTRGEPLSDLLHTVADRNADLLVVGARGTSGVDRLLLGSVAEGALNRSPVPVLICGEVHRRN
jgi:nucleotide-binding universal stress UspA family protein